MQFIDAQAPWPADALRLANTEDVTQHADALRESSCVVLDFPSWTDGRAYSQAVVLRGRLRYRGQVCATGQVLADMLPLLRRCGFDAVALAPGQDRVVAERAASAFVDHYQADARLPSPRFTRESAEA